MYSCTLITEIRIYCGFRKKVIQEANRPCDVSHLQMAYLHDFWSKATKSHIFLYVNYRKPHLLRVSQESDIREKQAP